MIPDRKYKRQGTQTLISESWNCGTKSNPAGSRAKTVTTTRQYHSFTEMVRQRPKPKCLSPTNAFFEERAEERVVEFGPVKSCTFNPSQFGQHYLKIGHWRGDNNYVHVNEPANVGPPSVADRNNTINAARAKFTGNYAKLGESFAELNKTLSMISNRGMQLYNIGNALVHGRWSQLSDLIRGPVPGSVKHLPKRKRLANGWLELQFGWLPIVSDVFGAASAFQQHLYNGQRVRKSSALREGGFGDTSTMSTHDHTRRAWEKGTNATASVSGCIRNTRVVQLNQLGLLNPAELAWDMMRFSFVVDWFVPIGPTLSALTAGAGMSSLTNCLVYEEILAQRNVGCHVDIPSRNTRRVHRVVSSGTPFEIGVKPTTWGAWKFATTASLLTQLFYNRKR